MVLTTLIHHGEFVFLIFAALSLRWFTSSPFRFSLPFRRCICFPVAVILVSCWRHFCFDRCSLLLAVKLLIMFAFKFKVLTWPIITAVL